MAAPLMALAKFISGRAGQDKVHGFLRKLYKGPVTKYGVNNYKERSKPQIGRHKKNMNKNEKLSYKKYRGQGR